MARGVTLVTAHTQDDSSLNWRALAQSGTTLVVYMGVAKLPEVRDSLVKKGTHLALDDIRESIAELQHYRKHFIKF